MYEYKVIPAPLRTVKVKGLNTPAERFAHLLEGAVNAEAGEGWEFVRAETLPCEERKGLTGTAKSFQSVLVFRRAVGSGERGFADGSGAGADHADSDHAGMDAAETPAPQATASEQAPRLSLVATRHEPEARPSVSSGQQPAQTARQEPVLRPGAARNAAPSERPEPVLRTRATDEGDNRQ